MTVGVEEEEGVSPALDFSPLNMVERATQHATWNINPQRYLRLLSKTTDIDGESRAKTNPNTAERNPEKPPSLSP